jgi:hypothetical protein
MEPTISWPAPFHTQMVIARLKKHTDSAPIKDARAPTRHPARRRCFLGRLESRAARFLGSRESSALGDRVVVVDCTFKVDPWLLFTPRSSSWSSLALLLESAFVPPDVPYPYR